MLYVQKPKFGNIREMRNEFEKLIEAAKDYKEYQSVGNGAKLNCAMEAAELALRKTDVSVSLPECSHENSVTRYGIVQCGDCGKPI